ncbi:hypothetical protein WICPIJ_001272 [Wickerhamomyces pijperi]|uniref:Peptide transporter PTR2 n=1 Tax=Wickerhamomyces pijperi TaxID=599730 RepID=A0A9P8QB85_WICPI|nr:hypothetical protein WICPIJ_001272 [Wickerhamomyces pijperi]
MDLEKLKYFFSTTVKSGDSESVMTSNEEVERELAEIEEYNQKYPEPTAEEYSTLPIVPGHAPYVTYLVCLIELADEASYYGVRGCLNNFIQLPLPDGGNGAGAPPRGSQKNAGALGLGLQASSAIGLLLTFLGNVTPLIGGYLADKKLGRVRTIWWGIWIGGISHIIMIIAAIPSVLKHGHSALAPTILSILTVALGSSFIKPNLLPLLYDQYEHKRDVVVTDEKTGEKKIISRQATLQRMTLVFYWTVNVGGFFAVATSYSAKRVGFWLAFMLPGIIYFIMVPVFISLTPKLKKETPAGYSILGESLSVLSVAFEPGFFSRMRKGEFWEYAKPSSIAKHNPELLEKTRKNGEKKVSWTDQFVSDVRVTISATYLFLYYVIYLINDSGLGSVSNSQANGMVTNGVPNDLISNINPLNSVQKIFIGFILASTASVAGAIIQYYVYKLSPCGDYASNCDIGTGVAPISVWVECVVYALQAISECFAMTTGYEIAYTRAPEHMRGLVMAIFLFMGALSAALGEALTGALVDPHITWVFGGTAIAGFVFAFAFLFVYRNLLKVMDQERQEKEEKLKLEYESRLERLDTSKVELISDAVFINGVNKEKDVALEAIVSNTISRG